MCMSPLGSILHTLETSVQVKEQLAAAQGHIAEASAPFDGPPTLRRDHSGRGIWWGMVST